MAPVPNASGFALPHGFSLIAFILFCSVLSIAFFVALFFLGRYVRRRFAKANVDIESNSPTLVTIPIPDLPMGTHWVEFEHEGKTYRYPSRQAQALSSPTITSSPLLSPTETKEDSSSLPSLGSDEGSDGSSEDDLEVYGGLCASPAFLDISQFMDAAPCDIDVPEIRIHECEDPMPINDDLQDTALVAALSVTNLAMDFLPTPEPSFNAPRDKSGDDGDDFGTSGKVARSIVRPRPQRTPSKSLIMSKVNRENFRRVMAPISRRSSGPRQCDLGSISE
ncbi:hypothetical protein NLI96_g4931 [Meripilus lineatus]|uniref:Uncharacterized protein n=1 Tax=Meripilus lineatus TaxID=2056292 RepID=A0AAD5V3X6_9APHY|nr:hypothetical protein NLI96_g4931 [Physisporinus lineatus]